MAHQHADLVKIGKEGFSLIDKMYGPSKKHGKGAYADVVYKGSDNPRRKEVISRSSTQSSNMVTQTYRAIYKEVRYYHVNEVVTMSKRQPN